MKRIITLGLSLLLILTVFAGCSKKKTTETSPSESPAPESSVAASTPSEPESTPTSEPLTPPAPADGVLSVTKDGSTLTVKITLAEDKNGQVSLLLLDDLSHKNYWSENPEHLIDIAQTSLDDKGEATVTLQLKDENAVCHLLLTAKSGSYSAKVNG